jgi:hypothetical protein
VARFPQHGIYSRLRSNPVGFEYCAFLGPAFVGVVKAVKPLPQQQVWTKFPDATIPFGDPESKPSPSVVFEVRFTESYDDLVNNARQWLQKSGGEVRLVILVNIEEDVRSQRAKQKSGETRKRIRELTIKFGTAKAEDRERIGHRDSDVESDAELYNDIRSTIVVEDWRHWKYGIWSAILQNYDNHRL